MLLPVSTPAFTLIAANATYLEVAIITLISNARYLLMSCALTQRFAPGTPFFHRLIIAYDVTDELFGITIARSGYLNPFYTYGCDRAGCAGLVSWYRTRELWLAMYCRFGW